MKRICITTVFDNTYKLAGAALFKSIRKHTDCLGIDFKVITSDPIVAIELGIENCHLITDDIASRYKSVEYRHDVPKESYYSSWYRYEIFGFTGYDRVICIDSDCICVEDISFLFSDELDGLDIISVEDHIVSKGFSKNMDVLRALGLGVEGLQARIDKGEIDIQPALIVANSSVINSEFYEKLLRYANSTKYTYSLDQGMLNDFIYMEKLRIRLLGLEWNFQDVYETNCPELGVPTRPIIIHCQASKPFIRDKTALDPKLHKWHDLWWKEFNT